MRFSLSLIQLMLLLLLLSCSNDDDNSVLTIIDNEENPLNLPETPFNYTNIDLPIHLTTNKIGRAHV